MSKFENHKGVTNSIKNARSYFAPTKAAKTQPRPAGEVSAALIGRAYTDAAYEHLDRALALLELVENKQHAMRLIDVMVGILEEKNGNKHKET